MKRLEHAKLLKSLWCATLLTEDDDVELFGPGFKAFWVG